MNSRRYLQLFGLLTWGIAVLLARLPVPAAGQSSDTQAYLPLVFSPLQPPAWIGPYGGRITAVAAHAEVIFAGTWGSGIYRSTDYGATWTHQSTGLGSLYIGALAIDPENNRIAYAGTRGAGIYKTLDGGATWFPANNGVEPYRQVYTIAIDPHDGENILAGTRSVRPEEEHPPWYGIVYRTTDQGITWKPRLTGIGGSQQRDWVYSIAVSYQNSRLVYAATHEHGIFRSNTFGNKNWEAVNTGINNFTTRGIVVNPLSESPNIIVYTGTWTKGNIFRSNNGGDTWFLTNGTSNDNRILQMRIDPGGNIIYAATFRDKNGNGGGILRSTDGGNTWRISGLSGMDVVATAIDSQNANRVFGGTNGQGLFRSTDYGATWSPCQNGLHAASTSDLLVSAGNSQKLYAGTDTLGVQSTGNGGATWSSLGVGLENAQILALASPPEAPQTLYALTAASGLYRCNLSQIANNCWIPVPINFPLTGYPDPVAAPQYPIPVIPFLDDEISAFSASPAGKPALQEMIFAPSSPQTAYLATYGAGIYKSLDGGATWSSAGLSGKSLLALTVDARDENHVFAASYTHIWYSTDGGASWADNGFSGADVYALAMDNAGTLYAGTSNGIYRYQSGGWTHLALPGVPVTEIALRPDKDGWLYAGTPGGLYISRNGGDSWRPGPPELNGLVVNAVTFDPGNPRWIYVSTATQGVLRIQDYQ